MGGVEGRLEFEFIEYVTPKLQIAEHGSIHW